MTQDHMMKSAVMPARGGAEPPTAPTSARTGAVSTSRTAVILVGVFLLAFLLRAFHLGPSWDIHVDELTYLNISQSVLDRLSVRLYGEPFYLHPPAYFFLEAALLRLLHPPGDLIEQIYAARYLNVVLGSLSASLIYLIGARILGWRAGLTAALLFALDPFSVRTNSQTLLETSAVFWVLLGWWGLFRAAGRGATDAGATGREVFRRRDVAWAGVAFGLALLTKDMLVFLTLLPLAVCFVARFAVPRAAAVKVALVALLTYLPYPLVVLLIGDGRLFAEAKFSGLARFLGAAKTTGFRRSGGPSLSQALASNLQTFGTTYLLVVLGAVAVALLWRSRAPLQRLLALWVGCAYVLLGFSVLIGTLEEQFFYYLTVPAMLAVSAAFWSWRERQRADSPARSRSALLGSGAALLFTGWTLAVWAAFHLTPSNGYEQIRSYLKTHVQPNSRISTMTEESIFLTAGYVTGVWKDLDALRGSQVQYVVLSTQQVRRGYGYATPALESWLDAHAQLLTSAPSRSYGALNLYQLPVSISRALPNSDVAHGTSGWLFLPTEYQADPATLADPASAGAYAAETLSRIGRLLKGQQQQLQVLLVPAKSRVYAQNLPEGLVVSPVIKERYARTTASLRQSGVLAPDLAAAFEAAASRPGAEKLFLKQDHHWTPQGAQVAAQTAALNLSGRVDLNALPTVTSGVTSLPEQPSALRSLYGLLPVAEQKRLKPELYQPIQVKVKQASDTGLLGGGEPEITLVGSSFSGIPSLSFGPLLEHSLGHEVLNVAESSEGPWAPMLTYLRSDTYRQTPPKLVEWEFWENFLNNQGVGTVPFGYLLDAAANILNACPAAGSDTAAPTQNQAGGYQEISVAGAANPLGDYLHLKVTAPGQTTLRGEFAGPGQSHAFTLPLPGDASAHDVNVPIYAAAGNPTERVRLYLGGGRVAASRLCHLPAYVTEPAYLKLGRLDLLQSSAPPGTRLTGLAEIETTGHRWGTGQHTSVSFFSATDRPLKLKVKFRAPIDGQGMNLTMNGLALYQKQHLIRDDVTDLSLTLQVRAGLNTLELTPRVQNRGQTRFAPQDPRPTTVEFTEFLLDDQ